MIRIGIAGYGNLGKGVEAAIRQNPDMELAAVLTRRGPEGVSIRTEGVPVYAMEKAAELKDKIDVLILCGGSATDLPVQTPKLAVLFNVVDSFDTHAKIPEHFSDVDAAAKAAGTTAVISAGWDPGMFSLNRLYAGAILPEGKSYTFWGKGVSQGHSDAIRRIEGVKDARQYTIPVESALEAVRSGKNLLSFVCFEDLSTNWRQYCNNCPLLAYDLPLHFLPFDFLSHSWGMFSRMLPSTVLYSFYLLDCKSKYRLFHIIICGFPYHISYNVLEWILFVFGTFGPSYSNRSSRYKVVTLRYLWEWLG